MHAIDLNGQPFDLGLTLACGQAFRWGQEPDGKWRGVVRDRLLELRVERDVLLWRTYPEDDPDLIRDYLRLADNVHAIYAELASSDPHMAALVRRFHGLRLLRQNPEETLLSFVCSTANSIPRISASIEALAECYGTLVCELDGSCYHTFPSVRAIACCADCLLDRPQLLGFRDRTLREVARQVLERGDGWLMSLRKLDYAEARARLLEIRGVGRKIADCVCLFALDKDEAVPVDTHIRQIAAKLWMPDLKSKTLTDAGYGRITAEFANRYGALAGWAQQFLYYEHLTAARS